eukprot:6710313-Alexandrium_andersonii.AAC.1
MQTWALDAPHEARRPRRDAGGARLWKAGLRCLQIPIHGEGHLARRASWDRDPPGKVWGRTVAFDWRVRPPYGCSDP